MSTDQSDKPKPDEVSRRSAQKIAADLRGRLGSPELESLPIRFAILLSQLDVAQRRTGSGNHEASDRNLS